MFVLMVIVDYVVTMGLVNLEIEVTMNVNDFRNKIYDYIMDNENKCIPSTLGIRGYSNEKTYLEREIRNKIWKHGVDFSKGCGKEFWVDAGNHLPALYQIFSVNMILYDIGMKKTSCVYQMKHSDKKK